MNILFCGDKNIQNGLLIAVISLLEHRRPGCICINA